MFYREPLPQDRQSVPFTTYPLFRTSIERKHQFFSIQIQHSYFSHHFHHYSDSFIQLIEKNKSHVKKVTASACKKDWYLFKWCMKAEESSRKEV